MPIISKKFFQTFNLNFIQNSIKNILIVMTFDINDELGFPNHKRATMPQSHGNQKMCLSMGYL